MRTRLRAASAINAAISAIRVLPALVGNATTRSSVIGCSSGCFDLRRPKLHFGDVTSKEFPDEELAQILIVSRARRPVEGKHLMQAARPQVIDKIERYARGPPQRHGIGVPGEGDRAAQEGPRLLNQDRGPGLKSEFEEREGAKNG
jgi:hypothetical protein